MPKQRLIIAFVTVLVVHFLLIATNNRYIYTVLNMTVFKGKLGPSIDEYEAFANDTVQKGEHLVWPLSRKYNSREIPEKYLSEHERLKSVAYLVIHKDSIIHEQYWDDYGPDSHSNSFSMAKSIVSSLVGVAIMEGKIKSVDEPVCNYLPEYCDGLAAELTIQDLLNMSAGINFDEDYLNPFAFPAKANYGRDLRELVAEYQVVSQPGEYFNYQSGVTQILSFLVEKVTGQSVAKYASEKLWKPMGARDQAYWSLDHEGGEAKAFCCFNSNARDFARFGYLYLHNGNWHGKQLIDSAFVEACKHPATELKETNGTTNNRYKNQWWQSPNYRNKYDIYYMRGILGQYVIVIPEEEIIVVRLGHKRDKPKDYVMPSDMNVWIDGALELSGISLN